MNLVEDLRELVLRKCEDHGDRLHLRNDYQPARVGGVDNVAWINEAKADASGDWRSNA